LSVKRPAPVLPLVTVQRASATPLYRQLREGYRAAIVERRLRPGQRLPSTRALAAELGISRIPVLQAFQQLLAEGYFESRVGAGTFVASALPQDARAGSGTGTPEPTRPGRRPVSRRSGLLPPPRVAPWLAGAGAFRMNETALEHFPFATWGRLVSRHARHPRRDQLAYGDPMGSLPFREALASYLRSARGVRCEAEQVMVVSGSQQALELTSRVLLEPGSAVWVEEPGYGGARDVLTMAGARLVPVPVDGEGLDVQAGAALFDRVRAVYVTPSHQYPLGMTMTASRRLQLLDWARRRGAWVIEDDYDSEYRYGSQPVASLQGLDRDARVVYIGTFSKVLFPALRVGYVVLPPDLVPRFAAVREAMDICPPALYQAALTDFLGDGHFARHVRKMRELYGGRRAALADALAHGLGGAPELLGDEAGLHLTLALPRGGDRQVAMRAAARGLLAMPLSSCYLGPATRQGLVLGFGGTPLDSIVPAVQRLSPLLAR